MGLRKKGDEKFNQATAFTEKYLALNDHNISFAENHRKLQRIRSEFEENRATIDRYVRGEKVGLTPKAWIAQSTAYIFAQTDLRNAGFHSDLASANSAFLNVTLKQRIWEAGEYSGRIRAIMGGHISGGKRLNQATLSKVEQYWYLSVNNLNEVMKVKTQKSIDPKLIESIEVMENKFLVNFSKLKSQVFKEGFEWENSGYSLSAGDWIKKSTEAINSILAVSNAASLKPAHELNTQLAGNDKKVKVLWATVGFMAILIVFALVYFRKWVLGPLNNSMELLSNVASEVTVSSSSSSESSNSLSETATEQATSLEETASSLEELSAMVKNNVGQAESSRDLATQMKEVSDSAKFTVESLVGSMSKINQSNNDIQTLVKVIEEIGDKTKIIDDIVFQTKILSFNASVEAERAGEHGRGFSVVAQEVSNLAQVSGKAAGEISAMVKESVKKVEEISASNKDRVEEGNGKVSDLSTVLDDISDKSGTILESSDKIVVASKDQSTGISQVNEAISQLDQATQMTAELARSASNQGHELDQQAGNLRGLMANLSTIIFGGRHSQVAVQSQPVSQVQNNVVHLDLKRPEEKHQHDGIKVVGGSSLNLDGGKSESTGQDDEWEKL
ncbi:MAG: hypothetical protein HOE90_04495 [Bacteriovoracaceae bacterium]|nr:hypothetical protein [Bacteriovoracaceae bacterium]